MKKLKLLFVFMLVFCMAVSLQAAGSWVTQDGANNNYTVKGNFGSYPKAIHGIDGSKHLTDLGSDQTTFDANKLKLANGDSSLLTPVGNGQWQIKLRYSPGYTIDEIQLLYSEQCTASDSQTPDSWWYNDGARIYKITNVTIPSTSDTYVMNWYDTPSQIEIASWSLDIQPDSGRLLLYWKKNANQDITGNPQGNYGDVDSADTGQDYGYKLFRASSPGGPYTWVNDTYITSVQYTDPANSWKVRFTDDSSPSGLVNGDTYYYVVFAVDAYGVAGDTSAEISGVPAGYIDVWFKVDGADIDYIKNHGNEVYMTPYIKGKPYYFNKVRAKIAWGVPRES